VQLPDKRLIALIY